jgi:hypothetical protein
MEIFAIALKNQDKSKGFYRTLAQYYIMIVTLEDLAAAIATRVNIDIESAMKDANFVMDLFGFEDRIIDNILEPEDRQLFYILEEEGMLITEREETTIYDGRSWRTHYWYLNKDMILRYREGRKEKKKEEREEKDVTSVYEEIPDELWFSREL